VATRKPAEAKLLTAEEIWAAPDLNEEDVEIPEWGGCVKVRALTKGQHQSARKRSSVKGMIDPDLLEVELLVLGLSVPELTRQEAARLKEKKAGVVERILGRILVISGLEETPESLEAAFRD
jgi:hypothetical protein